MNYEQLAEILPIAPDADASEAEWSESDGSNEFDRAGERNEVAR